MKTLQEIQEELENLKCELWQYCEEANTQSEKKVKEYMNWLLDWVDNLVLEREQDEL